LLVHFRTQHLAPMPYNPGYGQQPHTLDWKEDMIELPSERIISGLIHAPGMNDEKLLMIATVFPSLFPMSLPKIGVIDSNGLASPALSGTKDASTINRSSDVPIQSGPSSRASAQRDSPATARPSVDEYGPPCTLFLTQTTKFISSAKKQHSYRDSQDSDRRQRGYAEPRYYVGSPSDSFECSVRADNNV
jgi:hypothetical protein